MDPSLSPNSTREIRKRTLRACDGCRHRRMKCEDHQVTTSGKTCCKVCRENREECTFEAPVKKRGPRPGWRLRARSTSPQRYDGPSRTPAAADFAPLPTPDSHAPLGTSDARESSASPSPGPAPGPPRPRTALSTLPTALVDELLAVYFTHVHNVWPLIYKPLFHINSTSSPLLHAMLAIASCVAPPDPRQHGVDCDKLFHMAERALHHCRMESRIDLIQSLILLSLRQTGCGDKHMAFSYAGRACCMALNLGLNLAAAQPESQTESEIRSRVYWNCYVLDKTLAEETGRSFLLPYRRSSTPLPSMNEADEFETWPPLPTSSLPLPRSVRHIVPRRGYVMSCFVWTCQLGMIVEDILDLDQHGPPPGTDPRFVDALDDEATTSAERLGGRLDAWRSALPPHLDVDPRSSLSPMPHHIVGVSWYYTAQILLLSRFIKRKLGQYQSSDSETEFSARAHATCSKAAEVVVDLLACLDRHRLLSHTSADIIHILSLATLFEAFDSSDTDMVLAERAKQNFAQCCIWLRDCSSAWPAASAHKLFFEGLIQGGLKLSNSDLTGSAVDLSPDVASSSLVSSPPIPEGLRAIGRNLSTSDVPRPRMPPAGMSSLFQLPQFYWNHLTNAAGQPSLPNFDLALVSPDAQSTLLPEWPQFEQRTMGIDGTLAGFQQHQQSQQHNNGQGGHSGGQDSSHGGEFNWQNTVEPSGAPLISGGFDQAAIYSALMSFMVEAAKSH